MFASPFKLGIVFLLGIAAFITLLFLVSGVGDAITDAIGGFSPLSELGEGWDRLNDFSGNDVDNYLDSLGK